MKVLLLEDDLALSDILNDYLMDKGYDVTLCNKGEDALEKLIDSIYDFAILDVNTPTMSGLDVLKYIRNDYKSQTPIIIITAYQDTKHLKTAFELGSDDYIKKPFDLEELEQRINKLCRYFSLGKVDEMKIDDNISFLPSESLVITNGKKIRVAQKEKEILKYFITHSNRVISSEELLQNIWKYDEQPTDATIRVYIKNLREILGKEKIETIRGIGYKFEQK
ncbi:response regulator transcription factor [Arcobacter sp. F2176]|uniref:response regulator transcription factor n=1 Tax=unclassified Arcobacter TaxID=2593671 RepID=UPI00100C15B8|nr:response regulator transcription factor [Arcobacter sp. F2176]RXJ81127.1 DNA-binding response regulator [Arcobacter sp. F2176]